jgi:hypothetical protein
MECKHKLVHEIEPSYVPLYTNHGITVSATMQYARQWECLICGKTLGYLCDGQIEVDITKIKKQEATDGHEKRD